MNLFYHSDKNLKEAIRMSVLCLCGGCLFLAGCGSGGGSTVRMAEDPATEAAKISGDPVAADASDAAVMPAWKRLAAEKDEVTFDWYINFSWFSTKWGGNVVSDKITEETGVNINFVVPMGNEQEKLNALIASDDLPDLVTLGYWETALDDIINGDLAYALNELADTYDPYFYEVSDPTAVNWYMQEDGNIYSYPNSSTTPLDMEGDTRIGSNTTFLVRKDIYEAIGSPDMSTQEGFYEAVKMASQLYPEIDGEPLIPIGAHVFDENGCTSFDRHLMDFLAVDWERDGAAYDRYTDPEYLSWLKLFRRLGAEGYLANDIFVDTRTQMEEKLAKGRYFCMLYQFSDMRNQQKTLYDNDPDSIYIAVEGPRSSDGSDPTLPVSSVNGWTVTLISKNCRDPERAIAFLDYLLSEHGQKMVYLGVEGVTYEVLDEIPVLYEDVKALLDTDRAEYDRLYGADDAYWMLQDNVMQLQWAQETSPAMEQIEEWSHKYAVYDGEYDYYFPSGSEAATIDFNCDLLWSKTLPKLLLADSDETFDAIMEEFVRERETLGYEILLDARTQYLTEAKEKLGIEGENEDYTYTGIS